MKVYVIRPDISRLAKLCRRGRADVHPDPRLRRHGELEEPRALHRHTRGAPLRAERDLDGGESVLPGGEGGPGGPLRCPAQDRAL